MIGAHYFSDEQVHELQCHPFVDKVSHKAITYPYKRIAKAKQENTIKPNHLERHFKAYGPKVILLTDITYLYFGRVRKPIYLPSKKPIPIKYSHMWLVNHWKLIL